MAVMEAGSAARRAAVADLEAGLGPFDDPDWRADLMLLSSTVRAGAMLMARDCEVIVALADRVPRSSGDESGGTPWTSFVREVAVAKKISDQAAHAEIALSRQLTSCHPVLLAALHAGKVPPQRARLLVEECARYTDLLAGAADRLLTGRLVHLPPWRIKQEVSLLALRLDPEAAARREAAATAGRGASLTALADAQAEVALTGPAPLVQRWWDALTGRARALKAAGDPRTLTALRFDLAISTDPRQLLGHDALAEACGIDDPAAGRTDPQPTDEQPTDQGPADQDQPHEGEVDLGPAPAAEDDSRDGPVAEPPPAAGSDRTPEPMRPGLGSALTDDARCTRPVQASITVPAATALGLADEPGWLDGYGWISAPLSRQLLTVAELRKACLAPHTGQLVDRSDRVHRTRPTATALRRAVQDMVLTAHRLRPVATDPQPQHDPSPGLEALVHARDRWCDGPTGAAVPARRTDTDHHTPWPAGATRASNLLSRAGRTHQLKHRGWTATRDGTGTRWTSPAGQTAHNPAHHHPQPPLPPEAALPDADQLAARDRALTRARNPAGAGTAAHDWDTGPPRPAEPRPGSTGHAPRTDHGWPDDPAF